MFTSYSQIQEEVSVWGAKNFPRNRPMHSVMGIIEEVGELTHAHLKNLQGIRGTPEEHLAAKKDSAADMAVYAAHFCAVTGLYLSDILENTSGLGKPSEDSSKSLFKMAYFAGNLGVSFEDSDVKTMHNIRNLFFHANCYCESEGFSFLEEFQNTWNKVKQRDWTKNQVNGGESEIL